MEKSKLISVLKSFSKKDILRFEKFLISPYFECKQFTVGLFNELKKYHPHYNELDKKNIFKKSFPGKNYNDALLRKSLSLLTDYASKYIITQFPESESELGDYGLVNYSRRHTLFNLCEQRLKKFNKMQQDAEIHLDFFMYRYLLEREKVFYKLAAFSQKDTCEAVITRNEYLLLDFINKFALGLYEMDANKSGFNYDYPSSPAYIFYKNFNFEKFLSGIRKEYKYRYIYEISTNLMKMTFNPEDEVYFKLKEAVMMHYNKFHFSVTFGLYTILSAYSARKFKKENFEINKFMVEKDFFLKIGAYFQLKDFIKTFKAAISADEIKWAEKFHTDYTRHLNPEHQKNTELYCSAMIHYYKKDFEKALEFLSKVKYQLFSYKQDINVMALEIHYELGNYETSLSLVDSYKHFLRENKFVEESSRNRYNSFINMYTKLFNARLKKDHFTIGLLKKEVENEIDTAGKEWLKKKIDEVNL